MSRVVYNAGKCEHINNQSHKKKIETSTRHPTIAAMPVVVSCVFRCAVMVVILLLAGGNSNNSVAATTGADDDKMIYSPVATLNTEAYLGRWFQMAASAQFLLLELGGNCVTADYKLRPEDGKIALVNQGRPWLIPRWFARTTGFVAQSPNAGEEGSFTVAQTYLFSIDPDTVEYEAPGGYWILALGPISNGLYQWAVVSNPEKSLSFILARNVQDYNKRYKNDAKQVFEDLGGFNNLFKNKPIDTSHFLCFGYKDAIFT
jgi:lipocalin